DEFDNVAISRDEYPPTQGGGSSKKANEILNPLLEYMDGFRSTHNTIFVAATNRKDDVDEAMLRPGRFDRQYNIRLPQGEELLDIYRVQIARAEREADRSLFAADVDLNALMRLSKGFSGADIAEIIRRVLENKVAGELQGENQSNVTTDNLARELQVYERRKRDTQIGFRPNIG
ncbi:MAG: ATPase central domain-containing protein, partial [Candidatus Daviesbacteria bacterium GW2011_GWA1_42_6]